MQIYKEEYKKYTKMQKQDEKKDDSEEQDVG